VKTERSQTVHTAPDDLPQRIRLPFRITLLLLLVLITTVVSALRLFTAVVWSGTLQTYESGLLVAYVAITGAFWTLVGGLVLWSFWRGKRFSWLAMLAAVGGYAIWTWIDRLLIQPGAHPNWRFDALLTAVLLVYTGAVLLDPHNRIFFDRESHER
jgi:hypothetical protein